jgi:sugar O-acyltransferase (sialic acid O-acetyltransferase NeuD family)
MPTEMIRLIGSGGHALVVLDSLAVMGMPARSIALFDQNAERVGRQVGGYEVQSFDPEQFSGGSAHICIGDNKIRARVAAELARLGCTLRTIIDPRAIVSASARLGAGTFVAAGAIVSAQAATGQCCIVNHASVVDHECILSDFVHIAPGATLGGAVSIGPRTLIGAGANILPRMSIANDVTIGAGAVLIENAAESAVYVGVPAKKV